MKFITLEQFKLWARIDEAEPDHFLEYLIEAASAVVANYLNGAAIDLTNPPKSVQAATCLAAAAMYADREGGQPLTSAVRAILDPLRRLTYA